MASKPLGNVLLFKYFKTSFEPNFKCTALVFDPRKLNVIAATNF